MNKEQCCELFIAMCNDARTRFEEHGVAFARAEHKYRRVTIRTQTGDEATMCLANFPGGFALNDQKLTEAEYIPLRKAYDFGSGQRPEARWEEVRKMLGLS